MVWFFISCRQIYRKFTEDEMSVYAAQAAFFTILAAFPFIMVLLSVIQLTPLVQESDLMSFAVQTVPSDLAGTVLYIIDNLYTSSPTTLISVTALTALWSASRGMMGIERGLNRVCGVTVQRNYLLRRLICSGYTILFCLMFVLCLILLVFGEMLQKKLLALIPPLARFAPLLWPLRNFGSVLILFFFFLALYTVLPHRRQNIRRQLPGAIVAALGWTLLSAAFSVYFKFFNSYTVTYGSLGALILLLLWLYFCICILFFGAELNDFLTPRHHLPVKNP